uniref:Uncharacterized protein n=1 Tax=Meloidogyne incognita TaxID=6306 RepID=A0A914NKA3_MELIC
MTIDEGEFTPDFFKSANNLRELFNNEETVANILKENEELIKNNKTSTKELEMAMLSVEDKQDVLAAQKAKEENNVDLIEFDENTLNNGRGGGEERGNSCGYIESPSEQYLELINELKPIERYAVNFLTNEYRPALDKEFEETEALIRAKQKEFLQDISEDDVSDKGSIISKKSSKNGKQQSKHNNNNKTIEEQNITFDANLNEVLKKEERVVSRKNSSSNSLKNKKSSSSNIIVKKRYNTRNSSSLNIPTTTSQQSSNNNFAIPQLPQTSSNGFGDKSRKKGS